MSTVTKQIEDKALGLSALDRASLAEKLLSSLDAPHRGPIDQQWAEESEDRIKAFEGGEIRACEAEAVFERLEKKYNQ